VSPTEISPVSGDKSELKEAKNRNMSTRKVKITVDILMLIFVTLSYVRWSGNGGLIFHGIVGTVFAILVIVHLFVNRKWLVSVTKNMKAKKANKKTKRLYIVDTALVIVWAIAIITGFLAIPYFVNDTESFGVFSSIHGISSRVGGVIILIHIFQHFGHIKTYLKRK